MRSLLGAGIAASRRRRSGCRVFVGAAVIRGVVEKDAEGVAPPGAQDRHAMAHGRRRPAALRPDRPVPSGEHQALEVRERRRRAPRLRPRALLDEEELAAGVVLAGLGQVDHHLEREDEVAVEVAVQCVPVAWPVLQDERRRLGLPGSMALLQATRRACRATEWAGRAWCTSPGRSGAGGGRGRGAVRRPPRGRGAAR